MTVAPSTSNPPGTQSNAEPAWPGEELGQRVQRIATACGMTVAAVCEQWVREGVERFEAHHADADPDGSGRCSLRTGTCSLGPVPLPVQQ